MSRSDWQTVGHQKQVLGNFPRRCDWWSFFKRNGILFESEKYKIEAFWWIIEFSQEDKRQNLSQMSLYLFIHRRHLLVGFSIHNFVIFSQFSWGAHFWMHLKKQKRRKASFIYSKHSQSASKPFGFLSSWSQKGTCWISFFVHFFLPLIVLIISVSSFLCINSKSFDASLNLNLYRELNLL